MNKFRLLRADEIDCRVAQIKQNGLTLLLYKDARCDMSILDETVGAMNWQREHSRDNANCIVSIWDEDKGQWISKEDTGTESNTEAEKGLASDSFKRACVNWGIGRELYTAPFIWINADNCTIKTDGGKAKCFDKFAVSKISYNGNSEIAELEITNATRGAKAFAWRTGGKKANTPTPEQKSAQNEGKAPVEEKEPQTKAEQKTAEPYYKCDQCGQAIMPFKDANGKNVNLRSYAVRSKDVFGMVLCPICARKKKGA